ncbi:MAG: hypothetical protein COT73_07555 [Bdellovibrio sp. CG10_big_fil_rev_8_21_14_0_10_47_8]|nr:MAG: hypothetical protein COT73_07555 [Bdellovibrio sp. CG10_big_fil_rev_8_21_14_0_10_47_8]
MTCSFIALFLSTSSFAMMSAETEQASKALGANMVSEISFDQGKAALTDSAKTEIRDFVKSARASGMIDQIRVAVWADREYPVKKAKASKGDVALANKRAKAIDAFLRKDLAIETVEKFNMTQRPNALQKFLQTPTAKVKTVMEKNGAAPQTTEETGTFNHKAQASKALLMIYLKKM